MDGDANRLFMQLLDAHGAKLMSMLRRLCGNSHDAEDAFQEAAARVWRNFASRPRLRNPGSWIMKIGYHAFADARARRRPHEELGEKTDDWARSPGDAVQLQEMRDLVQTAISELPDPVREVVVLHYIGGLSLRQVAVAMNLSTGTVKSRLNSALGRLRSVLE